MSITCGIAQILSWKVSRLITDWLNLLTESPRTSVMSTTCPPLIMSRVGPLPYSKTSGKELVSSDAGTAVS